jgi:hypothetical protein
MMGGVGEALLRAIKFFLYSRVGPLDDIFSGSAGSVNDRMERKLEVFE